MHATHTTLSNVLTRWLPLTATVGLAIVNGSDASPLFDAASFYLYSFAKGLPLLQADAFYYLTSLMVSLLTLLVAGIPAALYERCRGLPDSTPGSLTVWLLSVLLLTVPTLLRLFAQDL
jgi:hypothetical protein